MESKSRLRIAIAGCGSLVRMVHLPLLAAMPKVEVVAIADPARDALNMALAQYPGILPFHALSELLDTVACDAVVVASPTHLHAEHAVLVLEHKKALYLEKPMASTLDEARLLIEVSQSCNTVAMMGFNYRYNPLWKHVAVEAKRQPLTALDSVFSLATRELPQWKRKRATGGGALLDLATHHLDLISNVFGLEPSSIEAKISSEHSEHDRVHLKLVSTSGIPISGSYSLLGREADEFTLKTASHSRRFSRYEAFCYPIFPPREFARYHMARWKSPWKEPSFAYSLEAWIHAIAHGEASPIPLVDGFRVMQWIHSAESGAG